MRYIKNYETISEYKNEFKIGDYVVIINIDNYGYFRDVEDFLKQAVGQVVGIDDIYVEYYYVTFNFTENIIKQYYKNEEMKPLSFNERDLRLATTEEIEDYEHYILNQDANKYNI